MTFRELTESIGKRMVLSLAGHLLPRGIDQIQDLANTFPNYQIDLVFDIGANVGQSAEIYLRRFPGARIFCFEPSLDTFRQLERTIGKNARVECVNKGLGSATGKLNIVIQAHSAESFLLGPTTHSSSGDSRRTESVDIVTLDDFCRDRTIERIGYLKIDTEGWDLEVLKGSIGILSRQTADFVEVEAGMNPTNHRHVPFQDLKVFLESHGYFVFGIYEQTSEWPTKEPHLRRTNAVYVSRRMIDLVRSARKVNR